MSFALVANIAQFVERKFNMAIKLIKLTKEYQRQLTEMMDEWVAFNSKNLEANTSPAAIFHGDYKNNFETYIRDLYDNDSLIAKGYVPATTLFLYDDQRDIFLGATNIRHYLNESLLYSGGYIGDGIRPSERRKGYATLQIKLSLEVCKELGIDRVLICCDKDNIGSRKSIISNGGVKENEVPDEGSITERYWIDIK